MMRRIAALLLLLAASFTLKAAPAAVFDEQFANATVGDNQVPPGWAAYRGGPAPTPLKVLRAGDRKVVLVSDDCDKSETGLTRRLDVAGGKFYQATVFAKEVVNRSTAGAYVQMRFFPSNEFRQVPVNGGNRPTIIAMEAPQGTTSMMVYIYTHFGPKPAFTVERVLLQSDDQAFAPPPPPAKAGNIIALGDLGKQKIESRNLCIDTDLVKGGKPQAKIAIDARHKVLAEKINDAIFAKTGTRLPIVSDEPYRDLKTLEDNLILIGNRDTNQAINKLYMLHYTLLDAVNPGKNGLEVRSLHTPFNTGKNVIFAGASDSAGEIAAVDKLIEKINALPKGKDLKLGYLIDIKLGDGKVVPDTADKTRIWEESKGYGFKGTFGWNLLAKNLALFYMTGDTKHAAEFLRLAFPTPAVVKELTTRDDEAYEKPEDPLVYPYHYRSLQMVLYWDLVEEHPFFTEEQRMAVTRKLYEQLNRYQTGSWGIFKSITGPRMQTGDRHAAWEIFSLYGIGRYIDTHYPCVDSREALRCAEWGFAALDKHMAMGAGSFFWFNTFMDPAIGYMTLSDCFRYKDGPVARAYGEALIGLSDGSADWSTGSTAIGMLTRLAYLNSDQAFIDQFRMLGFNENEFRLGQSWWPPKPYPHDIYRDQAGKWFKPAFKAEEMSCFKSKPASIPFDHLAQYLSYRQNSDTSGDFMLLDTKYESGRNPFHNYALINFRLNSESLLRGHHNQLALYCNGIASGRDSFFTDLTGFGRVGLTSFVDGTVPDFNDHDWRRVWILRENSYLLAVDEVVPRSDMSQSVIENQFETVAGSSMKPNSFGEYEIAPREKVNTRSPDVYVFYNEQQLLDAAVAKDKYYSNFLRAAGFPKLQIGDTIEIPFELKKAQKARTTLTLVGHNSGRGNVEISLDGKVIVPKLNHQTADYELQKIDLGVLELAKGPHNVTVRALDRSGAGDLIVSMGGLMVAAPNYKPQAAGLVLSCSAPATQEQSRVTASSGSSGMANKFIMIRPVKAGEKIRFVSALRPGAAGESASTAREGNKVALRLPHPAILSYEADGGLLLTESNHLWGRNIKSVAGLFEAAAPVTFDYDAASGKLVIRHADGKIEELDKKGFALPSEADLAKEVARIIAARPAPPVTALDAPKLKEAWTDKAGGYVSELAAVTIGGKGYILYATGNSAVLLELNGKKVREFQAAAPVGAALYWPEANLIVLGCKDEKVIAYTPEGVKKWDFTSEMDKELVESGKFYWFKEPIPGIHMLKTATLDPGKSRLFIGSAGTMEVLDENGKLLSRTWQTWGAVSNAELVPASGGRPTELLTYRFMGGDPTVYGMVGDGKGGVRQIGRGMSVDIKGGSMGRFGFSMIGRFGMRAAELKKGDGVVLVTDYNGAHNRLNIRSLDGKIIHEADLGPGFVAAGLGAGNYGKGATISRNIRGLEVIDRSGNGDKEIVIAFNRKFVAGFDDKLNCKWMTTLPDNPSVLRTVPGTNGDRLAVGLFDGQVLLLDGGGKIAGQGVVSGVPVAMTVIDGELVIGTDNGELKALGVPKRQ